MGAVIRCQHMRPRAYSSIKPPSRSPSRRGRRSRMVWPVACQNLCRAPDLGSYPRRSCLSASSTCSCSDHQAAADQVRSGPAMTTASASSCVVPASRVLAASLMTRASSACPTMTWFGVTSPKTGRAAGPLRFQLKVLLVGGRHPVVSTSLFDDPGGRVA